MLRCRSVYTAKVLKGLFNECINKKICRTLRQWWSEHQTASLEDLVQKEE